MRLSEAIRAGAKLTPQWFGSMSDGVGTCALGGAFLVLTGHLPSPGVSLANGYNSWRDLAGATEMLLMSTAPPCGCNPFKRYGGGFNVNDSIIHLNDNHRWTREAISEWVETIENKIEAEKVKGEVAHEAAHVQAKAEFASVI